MNYRHAFHAGNFADLVKHAALIQLLAALKKQTGPMQVIDTHAGRGLYDLAGVEAQKSGEAAQGIVRLMEATDAPGSFRPLMEAVAGLNGGGPIKRYPGSPWLIAQALGPKDSYLACELRPEEHASLRQLMTGKAQVRTVCADGYAMARERCPDGGVALVLIDPPFEKADDYVQIVRTTAEVRARNPDAAVLAWLPLKDLETFDGFLRDFEDEAGEAVVSETRMRPLSDPLKMNGCALVLAGGPPELEEVLAQTSAWTAGALGQAGGARTYRLGSQ